MWLITGASRGIGFELAKQILEKHLPVIAIVRNHQSASKLRATLSCYDPNLLFIHSADFSDPSSYIPLFDALKTQYQGKVTHLVNNAGVFPVVPILDASFDSNIVADTHVNLIFPIQLTSVFCQHLSVKDYPVIINICSSSSYDGFPNTSLYCSHKHGLLGFTRSIQNELRYDGYKVYSISPGTVLTDMSASLEQDPSTYILASDLAENIIRIGLDTSTVYNYEVRFARHQPK